MLYDFRGADTARKSSILWGAARRQATARRGSGKIARLEASWPPAFAGSRPTPDGNERPDGVANQGPGEKNDRRQLQVHETQSRLRTMDRLTNGLRAPSFPNWRWILAANRKAESETSDSPVNLPVHGLGQPVLNLAAEHDQ